MAMPNSVAIEILRGDSDGVIDAIVQSLRHYQTDHPQAKISLYRQNSVSVRIRIVDPELTGKGKLERSREFWRYLDSRDEDVQSDISAVLLLTPEEVSKSFANFEFDDPVPSTI